MSTELAPLRPQVTIKAVSRLDDSLFSKDLSPHYMQLAGKLSSSELVPKCFRGKPQDLYIAWAMGYQIGLSPEQAMQCIAVINGKPAMWGDDMLALCMAHLDFEDIIEEPIADRSGAVGIIGYRCTVKRRGMEPKSNEFTLEMAKRAGLLGKVGPWTQYPERMLKLRARGFTLRDAFPDALKGIKPREEVEDYIDAEHTPSERQATSRTEALKQDFQSKLRSLKDEVASGQDQNQVDHEASEEADSMPVPSDVGRAGKQEVEIHSEIKRLIAEKGFTEERLAKAMDYYDVLDIDSLSDESAHDFLSWLQKAGTA